MPLVYEHAKGAINAQLAQADHLDAKARGLFITATAIAGILIPFTLNNLSAVEDTFLRGVVTGLTALPLLAYLHSGGWFIAAYRAREYHHADDPNRVRGYTQQSKKVAYGSLFNLINNSYNHNRPVVEQKAQQVNWLAVALVLQTVVTIIHSAGVTATSLFT